MLQNRESYDHLIYNSDDLLWKVPVGYSLPGKVLFGHVGKIMVDANTGNLLLESSTPTSEIEANAERSYQKATL